MAVTTPPSITPVPTPVPQRNDRTTFSNRVDAFVTWLINAVTEFSAVAGNVAANATDAFSSATTAQTQAGIAVNKASLTAADAVQTANDRIAASASAASAAAIAGAFVGTSSTSWTPTVGAKTFITQTGEQYTSGVFLSIVSASTPGDWGMGQVTSYSGSTLLMDIQVISGSGAHTDWNISLAGVRGAPGLGVTPQAVGFLLSGGTVAKTFVVDTDATVSALAPKTNALLLTPTATGLKETKVAVAASAIDLATGNYFSKTAGTALTWTLSNVPAAGTVASFILDLTNGGAYVQTWWSGVKWTGGTAPTLTAAGRDSLGFFTHDGGTTWTGLVLGKDIK